MTTQTKTAAFPHQAAKLGWASPIIVFVLLAFGGQVASRAVIELIALLFVMVGIVSGVIALFGIPKYGSKGILAPALVGIILNGLLLFIFVTNFAAARAKARGNARLEAPPVIASNTARSDQSPLPPNLSPRSGGCA